MLQKTNLWFTKRRRAQSNDDYETWIEGGVVPTLNAFDNGDVRATTIIFYGNRVSDIRIQDDKINTLQARMGTGGNNMPLVAQVIGIQNTVIGRSDTAGPQGKGHTEEGEPMFTVDTTSPHAIADNSIVRRLTPLECERLQGFPDGWTEGQPDTHRYKQMGNAVAVPVVEWIVQGICDTFDIAG
jgi:site-specific DNA-cytosine methylase